MPSIAVSNLFHDKVRLAVTVTGIVFSVVLVCIQIGLFLGFSTTTSTVIDHSGADLWICSRGVRYIEVGVPFSERKLYKIRGDSRIAEAQKLVVQFSQWKRPNGAQESIELIGFNPDSRLGAPWNLEEGAASDLKRADSVIVDRFYSSKLSASKTGELFEINGTRARVVGFTNGIRTFTTAATVFASFKNAQRFARMNVDQTVYILARVRPGTDMAALKRDLMANIPDIEVFTTAEFAHRTTNYWMFSTGAGVTVIIAAVLGLIVGVVVVAQTIYAATVDHIREFGTLKAMGATNGYIFRIILEQAAISAVIGYSCGIAIAIFVVRGASAGAPILLPKTLAAGMFLLTLLMCCSAALVSINKVTRIDPALVFKG